MTYSYKTRGTCSSRIDFELDGGVVHNVKFTGGCNGNLKAISRLVEGKTASEIKELCLGITCGFKNTSCADQLAHAVSEALKQSEE